MPVNDDNLTQGGPLRLVEQLAALTRRRSEDEQLIASAHALRVARAETERDQRRADIQQRYDARRAAAQHPEKMQAEVLKQYDAERASVEDRLHTASDKMRRRFRARLKAGRKKREKVLAGETSRYAAHQRTADERLSADGELAALRRVAMAELALAADRLLAERGIPQPERYESPEHETFDQDSHENFVVAMQRAAAACAALRALPSVRMAGAQGLVVGFAVAAVIAGIVAGIVCGFGAWPWIIGSALAGGVVGALVVNRAAAPLARKQTLAQWSLVRGALAAAQAAAQAAFADAQGDSASQLTALAEKRDRKIHKADAARSKDASTVKATLQRKLAANAEKVAARLARIQRDRDAAIAAATGGLPQRLAELEQQQQSALAALDADHQERIAASVAQRDEEFEEVADDWQNGLRRWESALAALDACCQRLFPAWSRAVADTEQGARDGVRFGEYLLSPADFFPPDAAAKPEWATANSYAVPAILSFCEQPGLVLVATETKRAGDAIYNAVLRIIASRGTDEVRCTVVDAGEVASRFKRLVERGDISEGALQLATTAWQIERALSEHAEHIQRMLRPTDDRAEPRRVLAVFGLPTGAAADGLAALQKIMAHGASGGVTTLVCCSDAEFRELAAGENVLAHALVVRESERQYHLHSEPEIRLQVAFDEPPDIGIAMRLLRSAPVSTNGHADSAAYATARR